MRFRAVLLSLFLGSGVALAQTPEGSFRYTVRLGDTIYSIAMAHGTSAQDIMARNRLVTPTVEVGEHLDLPAPTITAMNGGSTPAAAQTPEPAAVRPAEVAPASAPTAAAVGAALPQPKVPTASSSSPGTTLPPTRPPSAAVATPAPAATPVTPAAPVARAPLLPLASPPRSATTPTARAVTPAVPLVRATDPLRGPRVWKTAPAVTHGLQASRGFVQATSFGTILPPRAYLGGLGFAFQSHNNCGPASVSSVLAYFGMRVGQEDLRKVLRPRGGYMRSAVIAPYVGKFGLRARVVKGSTLAGLKRLVAQGVPVIVLQWLDRPNGIPHFRVVRGYDDAAGIVWVTDSMVGGVAYLSYRDFDRLWNTQGRQMIPVYPAAFERAVEATLGAS